MTEIATWGGRIIHDSELVSLRFRYGLRLAKLSTVYQNPIIQYIGKNVVTVDLEFITLDEQKSYDIWNEKQSLNASIRNLTLAGTNYGDFYLANTEVEFLTNTYLNSDTTNARITTSTLIKSRIALMGVQEMPI